MYILESNPLSKALAIANFLVLGISAQLGGPQISQALHLSQPPANCVAVFETSMESETAYPVYYESGKPPGGFWECLSKGLQKMYFNGSGWNGDKDIQIWYDRLAREGIIFRLTRYSGSPTYSCATDNQDNTVCDEQWLEYVAVYAYIPGDSTDNPHWVYDDRDSFTVTLHVDGDGLISNVG